jgi:UTP--glucose-1-phosphate uridylyltransferase
VKASLPESWRLCYHFGVLVSGNALPETAKALAARKPHVETKPVKITRAVITAAAKNQRTLPLQTLIDRDGNQKPVLNIIVDEALRAGVDEICVVVSPGDETSLSRSRGRQRRQSVFHRAGRAAGLWHAVYCARDFVGDEPFLHMVGDHRLHQR